MHVISDITPPPQPAPQKHRSNRFVLGISAGFILFVFIALVTFLLVKPTSSVVPAKVRKEVDFSIYYPEQGKLPVGYTLDVTSFRTAQAGVVVYSVDIPAGKLIVSEEKMPDGDVMSKFLSTYIPLHTDLTTSFGKAEVGATGQGVHLQTVVSLPINHGPWMIVTGPPNISQADLRQTLNALTR